MQASLYRNFVRVQRRVFGNNVWWQHRYSNIALQGKDGEMYAELEAQARAARVPQLLVAGLRHLQRTAPIVSGSSSKIRFSDNIVVPEIGESTLNKLCSFAAQIVSWKAFHTFSL